MIQRFVKVLPILSAFTAGLACAALTILDAYVAGTISARVVYSGTITLLLFFTIVTAFFGRTTFKLVVINVSLLGMGLLAVQSILVPSRYIDGSKVYEIWRLGGPNASVFPDTGPYNFLATEESVDDLSTLLPRVAGRQIIPLGGPADARLVVCNEDEGWFTFDSDRYGFNNPDSVHDRLATERPIVIIGDSFVEGACTPDHFVSQLQRRLSAPVINLGKFGNGPLAELATLREFGLAMRPRTLVWVYFSGNDLERLLASSRRSDLAREMRSPLLRPYLDDGNFSQNLREHATLVDTSLKAALNALVRAQRELPPALALFRQIGHVATSQGLALYSFDLMTERSQPNVPPAIVGPEEAQTLQVAFRQIMRMLRESADHGKFDVVFVMMPDKLSCATRKSHHLDPAVRRIARDLDFRIIDLFETFGGAGCRDSVFAAGGPHLTPEGNKVVAVALSAELR